MGGSMRPASKENMMPRCFEVVKDAADFDAWFSKYYEEIKEEYLKMLAGYPGTVFEEKHFVIWARDKKEGAA
jgi:hypothetical protein